MNKNIASKNPKLVEEAINAIEAEMKSLGDLYWAKEPMSEEAYLKALDSQQPFLADKMTLPQWLQFVLIPYVRKQLATNGPWVEDSHVGVYAMKYFTDPKADNLVTLLHKFDDLFNFTEEEYNAVNK